MREILFKATRTDNGEWAEGYICKRPYAVQIGDYSPWCIHVPPVDPDDNGGVYNIDTDTVCQYSGKQIFQNENTKPCFEPVKVWENDLIAIYTITYDDDDTPVRTRIAVVKVEWDDNYKMLFAQCVEGDMDTIAKECDISYLDGSNDYPFTFWLEYMENSASKWWEWEIIGNAYDKEVEQ